MLRPPGNGLDPPHRRDSGQWRLNPSLIRTSIYVLLLLVGALIDSLVHNYNSITRMPLVKIYKAKEEPCSYELVAEDKRRRVDQRAHLSGRGLGFALAARNESAPLLDRRTRRHPRGPSKECWGSEELKVESSDVVRACALADMGHRNERALER